MPLYGQSSGSPRRFNAGAPQCGGVRLITHHWHQIEWFAIALLSSARDRARPGYSSAVIENPGIGPRGSLSPSIRALNSI
jgi:hypothetical protein